MTPVPQLEPQTFLIKCSFHYYPRRKHFPALSHILHLSLLLPNNGHTGLYGVSVLNWAEPHLFSLLFLSSFLSPLPSPPLHSPPDTVQVPVREADGEGTAEQFGKWQSSALKLIPFSSHSSLGDHRPN